MRAVTFNIHHGTVGRRGPVRPDRLGEVCAAFDADVLVLEEVDVATLRSRGADLAQAVADATGMVHAFGAARRFLGGWYGNAVLVRGEMHRWDVTALPRVPCWRLTQERRTMLAAEVSVDGRDLRVVGTHLAVPQEVNGPQLVALLRAATDGVDAPMGSPVRGGVEPGMVVEPVETTPTRGMGPVLVLGDLNRRTHKVSPQAAAVGLRTVAHGGTIPVGRPDHPIDHVLHTDHLRVREVEVRSTEMSDHCALLVDFDWVDEGAASD